MTQEDKELLLKDISARAQYMVNILVPKGVRINDNGKIKESDLIDVVYGVIFYNNEPKIVTSQKFSYLDRNGIRNFGGWVVDDVKPYLRSLSSMTKKEKKEYDKLFTTLTSKDCNFGKWLLPENDFKLIDFYNSHHFDYRGLIPMGLALEAKEGMY